MHERWQLSVAVYDVVLCGRRGGAVAGYVDAKNNGREVMKIEVTKANIRNGEPCNTNSCAIALAVKRVTHWKLPVDVEDYSVSIGGRKYALPDMAVNFIEKFDYGDQVKPFSFKLGKELR